MLRRLRPTPRRLAVLVAATVGVGSAVAYATSLNVGSWHLWAGSQALTKAQCTLTGTASTTDTYVDQGNATSSFGSSTTMLVQPTGSQQWSFVFFNLSTCAIPTSGGADSARLNLVITNTPKNSRTLTVTPVRSSWNGTLTWNDAQSLSYGSATATVATGTTNNATLSIPVTVDVDALIKNPSANFGWRISDDGSHAGQDTSTFATSDATSNQPQLVISYER